MAVLTVLEGIRRSRRAKRSYVTGFYDLQAAFYSVIVDLVHKLPRDPDDLKVILDTIAIPAWILPMLERVLQSPARYDHLMGTDHLAELLTEGNLDRWTTHKDSDKVMRPRKGSRPGVPLADFDFNVLFGAVHRYLDTLLRARGLLRDAQPAVEPFADSEHQGRDKDEEEAAISYVDDLTAHHDVQHPSQLVTEAKQFLGSIIEAAATFGLNVQVRKTKLFLVYLGANQRKFRSAFQRDYPHGLVIGEGGIPMSVVKDMRILGTRITSEGSMNVEVAHRAGLAATTSQPLRREVHARRQLSYAHKVRITDSIAISQMTSDIAVWTELSDASLTRFTKQYVRAYAQAIGLTWRRRKSSTSPTKKCLLRRTGSRSRTS